jgi:hypothetical protein
MAPELMAADSDNSMDGVTASAPTTPTNGKGNGVTAAAATAEEEEEEESRRQHRNAKALTTTGAASSAAGATPMAATPPPPSERRQREQRERLLNNNPNPNPNLQFAKKSFGFDELVQMDVFSYGVCLWAICTLQHPYQGLSPLRCYEHVSRGGRPSLEDLRTLGGQWGQDMAALIEQCWAHLPSRRPNFDDVIANLHDSAEGEEKRLAGDAKGDDRNQYQYQQHQHHHGGDNRGGGGGGGGDDAEGLLHGKTEHKQQKMQQRQWERRERSDVVVDVRADADVVVGSRVMRLLDSDGSDSATAGGNYAEL